MIVIGTADNHGNRLNRFDEFERVHAWIAERAREHGADVVLYAGDLYNAASVPDERQAVADHLTDVAETCSPVVVRGNHDAQRDLKILSRLRTKHPVIVEEGARVHQLRAATGEAFAVGCMAWPETAWITSTADSLAGAGESIRADLQLIMRGLGAQLRAFDGARLFAGHLMVDGSKTSHGQPLKGQPINVGQADLGLLGAHLGVLGHIHAAQEWRIDGGIYAYAGNPYCDTYGQTDQKSIILAEVTRDGVQDLQRLPTPCARMIHATGDWCDGAWENLESMPGSAADTRGAEIRFRFQAPTEHMVAAKAAAAELKRKWLIDRAADVNLEPQTLVETRQRMPDVAAALGPTEKLLAFWEAVGFDPGARRAPLLEKLGEIDRAIEEGTIKQ